VVTVENSHTGINVQVDMAEQGEVLLRIFKNSLTTTSIMQSVLTERPPLIVWFARGSSAHAVQSCTPVLTQSMNIPWVQGDVSAHLHDPILWPSGTVFLIASQSGDTPDLVTLTEKLVGNGRRVITMSNVGGALKRISPAHIDLHAGIERAVPATKSVFAQIATLLVVAEGTGEIPHALQQHVIESVAKSGQRPTYQILEPLGGHLPVACIGSGTGLGLARELAHKIQETSGLGVLALDSAEFEHGPVAIARSGNAVVAFTAGYTAATDAAIVAAHKRGASILTIGAAVTGSQRIEQESKQGWELLPDLVVAQRLTMMLAQSLGLDPDAAFGLSKVTHTFV